VCVGHTPRSHSAGSRRLVAVGVMVSVGHGRVAFAEATGGQDGRGKEPAEGFTG